MNKLSKYIFVIFSVISVMTIGGCIENDIPYPVEKMYITSLTAEGVIGTPVIDANNMTVTLELEEVTDIRNVNITSVSYSEKATPSVDIVGRHDMRNPLEVTLSLYQDYVWQILAKQNIPMEFSVEGQIGATEWDVEKHTATVYVGSEDHSNIEVTALKLGPEGISTYQWADGIDKNDFSSVRYVYVTYHGRTERWSLYVKTTEVKVNITKADGWAKIMWLYGDGISGTDLGFKYRLAGNDNWIEVSDVEVNGGSFTARVGGLQPNTEYEVMAYSNDDVSAITKVTTEGILSLENGGFEQWETIRKIVCPYISDETAYWGTGNPGAATVNATVTDKCEDIRPGSDGKYSARLESMFANLAGIGKFAAGNLFIGKYVKTVGTNGIVAFGQKFNARPTALKFWMKYNCGDIDKIGNLPIGSTLQMGDPDTGSIYIALGTWTADKYGVDADGVVMGTADSPVIIDTRNHSTFFDPKSEAVVAYGEILLNKSIGEWTEVVIPLNYTSTSVVPTHIAIVCSASRLGDYFTGSTKSVMWLDDMELIYE